MTDLKKVLHPSAKLEQVLEEINKDGSAVSVFGADFSARVITSSFVERFIYVCADFVTATKAYEILSSIRKDCVYFALGLFLRFSILNRIC